MDGGVELEQVVSRGHEAPLETDRDDASEEELAEAARLLDLTEDGLDRSLPEPIPADPSTKTQPCRHRSSKDAATGSACTLRCRVSMSVSSASDQSYLAIWPAWRVVGRGLVPGSSPAVPSMRDAAGEQAPALRNGRTMTREVGKMTSITCLPVAT